MHWNNYHLHQTFPSFTPAENLSGAFWLSPTVTLMSIIIHGNSEITDSIDRNRLIAAEAAAWLPCLIRNAASDEASLERAAASVSFNIPSDKLQAMKYS